ncbi:MAG: ATP synthase F1 subunit gamma [bacterium]
MSKLRDLKARIESVKKTKKMTQAMKMVSAAKFKRASYQILAFRPYFDSFTSLLDTIKNNSQESDEHPLFFDNGNKKHVVIVLTGDRGLCGGFNMAVAKEAMAFCQTLDPEDVEVICFGRKAIQLFKNSRWKPTKTYEGLSYNSLKQVRQLIRPIKTRFLAKEVGKVTLFYTVFKSVISSYVSQMNLLPIVVDRPNAPAVNDYIFEPDVTSLFGQLSIDYVYLSVYRAFMESKAAEEGARMSAMDSATSNAAEMGDQLTLLFNRVRQAKITTELAEIVAGANALA